MRFRNLSVFLILCWSVVVNADSDGNASFECHNPEGLKDITTVLGDEAWVFRDFDLKIPRLTNESSRALKRLKDAFDYHGITLVALPVPTKGMVYGHYVPEAVKFSPEEAQAGYHTVVEKLNEIGIFTPNLLAPALASLEPEKDPYFFKIESHWSPEGARLSAQTVAAFLREKGLLAGIPQATFETKITGSTTRKSGSQLDLEKVCDISLAPEELNLYETNEITEDSGLFDAESFSAVLFGTSYSDMPEWHFPDFLMEALEVKILDWAIGASGPFTAMQDYFLNDAFEDSQVSKLKLALWEFPVRANFGSVEDLRQLIPAVYGTCSVEESIAHSTSNLSGVTSGTLEIIENTDQAVQGSTFYVVLELSDTNLFDFDIGVSYAGGMKESLTINRTTRVTNTGKFFLEFANAVDAPVEFIRLEGLNNTNSTNVLVDARICRIPVKE